MKPESFREIWKTLNTMTQGSTGPGLIMNDSILIVVVFCCWHEELDKEKVQ